MTTHPGGRPLPAPSRFAHHWTLDAGVVYLNHGSFGACPRAVLEAQDRYRAMLEREPVRFFVEELDALMDGVRASLGEFLRCRPRDLVLVPNATTGVATVLRNLEPALRAGDEILVTDHEYLACCNNARSAAARAGAAVVTARVPFPVGGPGDVVEAVMRRVTDRTRLLLISHVTSPTALVFPLDRIVPDLERRGVMCLVDGAHAPGSLPALDLAALAPSFYTANCHKWLCTPKGSAFLHVREDRQQGFRPLVLSNFAERPKPGRAQFLTEFDYVGTNDPSACLTIPDAIAFMDGLYPGGWGPLMRRNHDLAVQGRDAVCRAIGVPAPAPGDMFACTATIPLPAHEPEVAARLAARPTRYHDALQDALLEKHRIQIPVWSSTSGARMVRLSAQLYNAPEQYEYLAAALEEELAAERRLERLGPGG